MGERPFTVQELAERWSCAPESVYVLIRSKRLAAFTIGGKLLRVRPEEVERWENAGASTKSEAIGSEPLGASTGRRRLSATGIATDPTEDASVSSLRKRAESRLIGSLVTQKP